MANFRKSFNFRNGVQVDEDNFIVNSAGLVGIGTSVPTETLDVRGSLKVVGIATIQDAFIGVATVQNKLEVGITSFSSGIITAKTGIVTYYGDARYLQGMPTSQWIDVDAGLGYTSIYAAGNVGVGTVDPRFTFQVGGNNNVSNFSRGVGISSVGDVTVSGILTATKFYGWGIGVTGLNASDAIATGTLNNDRLPSNINKPTGIITASSVVANSFVGAFTGTATTATQLTGTPNIVVGVVTATKIIANTIEVPNTGITTVSKLFHVGTGGTALAALEGGRIGIGSALPTSELQIRKTSGSLLEVIAETGQSRISIGQSVGVGHSSAVLRFGQTDKSFDILNNDNGSISMYLHAANNSGINTGRFDWIYGQTNSELMSLTYGGRLGIGKTNPDNTLHVVGTSTVTGNAFIGGNLTVAGAITGSITLEDTITSNTNVTSGISTFNDVETSGNITASGNIIVAAASSIGIGTTAPIVSIDARSQNAIFDGVSIGNTTLVDSATLRVTGGVFSSIAGVGTTATSSAFSVYGNVEIYPSEGAQASYISLYSGEVSTDNETKIGIGTTAAQSAVDFRLAGKGIGGGVASFMIPPIVTTSERVGLNTAGKEGAFIFNTDTKKFQGYTGTDWVDLH